MIAIHALALTICTLHHAYVVLSDADSLGSWHVNFNTKILNNIFHLLMIEYSYKLLDWIESQFLAR